MLVAVVVFGAAVSEVGVDATGVDEADEPVVVLVFVRAMGVEEPSPCEEVGVEAAPGEVDPSAVTAVEVALVEVAVPLTVPTMTVRVAVPVLPAWSGAL